MPFFQCPGGQILCWKGFLVGWVAAIFFLGGGMFTQKNTSWSTRNGGLEDDFPLSIRGIHVIKASIEGSINFP